MHTKLYGPLPELEKTVAFIAQAGIGIWRERRRTRRRRRRRYILKNIRALFLSFMKLENLHNLPSKALGSWSQHHPHLKHITHNKEPFSILTTCSANRERLKRKEAIYKNILLSLNIQRAYFLFPYRKRWNRSIIQLLPNTKIINSSLQKYSSIGHI